MLHEQIYETLLDIAIWLPEPLFTLWTTYCDILTEAVRFLGF